MASDAKETLLTDFIDKAANDAISCYGYINQLEKAKEEAVEFIAALEEYIVENVDSEDDHKNLVDETADILFMAYQVAKIVGIREVNFRLHHKAGRLLGRIHSQKYREKEKE